MTKDPGPRGAGLFQVAYVAADLDAAKSALCRIYDVDDFYVLRDFEYATKDGRSALIHLAVAFKGQIMLEIIQPVDGDVQFYRDFLPNPPQVAQFHHVNWNFGSEQDFFSKVEQFNEMGKNFPVLSNVLNSHLFYCDARNEIGHYIEGCAAIPGTPPLDWPIPRF